ncbi:MAG TPA: Clp protease N-terminal domain-containing protein [Bryobacteraceae bacterium]|nr:Clp protease N-terminal domain-containing protein [Bryobacteraceae bacterium]
MFERYTEKARRVIFFARYEASQHGERYIETPCLLLGVLREDKGLMSRLLSGSYPEAARLRADVEALLPGSESISTSVDLPLSHASKRALAYGAEESQRLQHEHIGTGHLLLGLLRESGPEAACLKAHGIELEGLRAELARNPAESGRDARKAPDQKLEKLRLHREFLEALRDLPPDRLQAGITLLKALASGKFEVRGTGPDGPFHFSFGGESE